MGLQLFALLRLLKLHVDIDVRSDPVRNPEQERRDAIAEQKQDEQWDAFCKPTFKADEYGIRRASYAAKGCDVGRSE